jgi:hypothetical protein
MMPNNSDGKHFCCFASTLISDQSVGKGRCRRLHGLVLAANGEMSQSKFKESQGVSVFQLTGERRRPWAPLAEQEGYFAGAGFSRLGSSVVRM